MVEQKARQCLAMADYGYVLGPGAQPARGAGRGPAQDPEVVRLFLGGAGQRERRTPPADGA